MRREPALITSFVAAALAALVAFNVGGLNEEQSALIVALIHAIGGAVVAAKTRPIAPAAFTAVVVAVADLMAIYNYAWTAEQIASVNGLVLFALATINRGQIVPAPVSAPMSADPLAGPSSARAA